MERMSLYFLFVLCLWYLMPCQCTTGKATTGCHGLFEFTCDDGQCVAVSQKCDGRQDCLDNSDERYCTSSTLSPGSTTSTPALTCRNGEVLVKNCTNKGRSHCLPFLWLCDGSSDCITDRDEVNCTATKNTTFGSPVATVSTPAATATATVNSTTTTTNSPTTTSDSRSTTSKLPATRVTSPTTLTKVLPASTTSSMAKGSSSTSGNRINPSKHTDVQRRRHEPSSLAIELGASFTAAVAIGILLLVICKMCRRQKVNIVICTQPGLQGSTITLQEFV